MIVSYDSLRAFVARVMLSSPERGLDGAIEVAAAVFDLPVDQVRHVAIPVAAEPAH